MNHLINIDLGFFETLAAMEQALAIHEAAKVYIRMGWKILPQKIGAKGYIKNLGIEFATDKPDIVDHWFNPKNGVYRGYNILGICPDGISVLDFDIHGDTDGFTASGLEPNDLNGLRVLTPTGGYHFYISDKVSFFKKTPGVDKKTACLLPPSLMNDKRYEWNMGGKPAGLSERMLEALGGKSKKKKQEIEEFASVAPDEFLKDLLTYFDPGCDYDEWCRVGMALHDNDPGDGHLTIFRDWSSGSSKYKEGECEAKWATFSFDKTRKVTLAWMIATARERGRQPTAADVKYAGINLDAYEAVMRMNKKYMVTSQGGLSILKLGPGSEYVRMSSGDFKNIEAANLPPVLIGERYVSAPEYWLKSKYRREGVVTMEYPGEERDGDFNQYRGFSIEPVPCQPSDVQFFLDHTLNVICRGNKDHCTFLLDVMAAKMQKPLDLIGLAVVLKGKEGSGKSSYGEIFRMIVGNEHAAKASARETLLGTFSGGMASKVFVVGEEAIFSAHKGEAERLKALITESPLDWNNKFVKQWTQRNCLFLMFTTNENWAIPAGMDSRRFFCLNVSDEFMRNTEYWGRFMALLGFDKNANKPRNPEYLGKVLYYLLNREITSNLSVAMETSELVEQRKLTNQDSFEAAFVDWVRQTFTGLRGDDAVIEGAGKEFSFAVVTYEGEGWIEAANLYADFRRFYNRYHSKGRGVGTDRDFRGRLSSLGMVGLRVRKGKLKIGVGKYPGAPDSKIAIAYLPSDLETKLSEQYPLFAESFYEDAQDD